MKLSGILALAIVGLNAPLAIPAHADYNVLHTFTGTTTDGASPYGALLKSGSTFYGTTIYGGTNNWGTFFRFDGETNAFSVLHSFAGGSDGVWPSGTPIQSGSNFYGTARGGGTNYGLLYKMDVDSPTPIPLHIFNGSDGVAPAGQLVLAGSTLYGTTGQAGVTGSMGSVYSYNLTTQSFHVLHAFPWNSNDGYGALSSLVLSGSYLYGLTYYGGSGGKGTLFRINTTTDAFVIEHAFAGGTADGNLEGLGALTLAGSMLYGITNEGGSTLNGGKGAGTLFAFNTDTEQFTLLHSFLGGANDGRYPEGPLVLSGHELYGMSLQGGAHEEGTIFQFDTITNQISILHSFESAAGRGPYGSLILSDSTLYGMTTYGGASNYGVLFSLTGVPEPASLTLLGCGVLGLVATRRRRPR